jgi:rod shape determining protein RodA
MNSKFLKLDWLIIASTMLLLGIGLITLYSVSFIEGSFNAANFYKQILAISIGMGLMLFFSFYDYRAFNSYSTKLYLSLVALLTVVFFLGINFRGTKGWIGVGEINFQAVEIAKLIMIIFLASFLSKKKGQLSMLVRIITSIVLVFIPVFLILKQPDFGSAAIVVGIWASILLVSGIGKKNLLIFFLVTMLALTCGWSFLKDYQKNRIKNVINPYSDPRGSGYNLIQSMVAVGSGGLYGKGLGHGSQSQLNFLPEKHTDFIFSVVAEELGFAGAVFVFALFIILFYRMKETARLARDNFGYLLAMGIMAMFFLQLLVNIGMNIGISPIAGVPLPLLSYGGSSIVISLASIGIIQSIYSRKIKSLD